MDRNLAKRMERLEFEVRRWKVLTTVVLITMTALVVAAASPSQIRVTPEEDQFVQQVRQMRWLHTISGWWGRTASHTRAFISGRGA